MTSAKNGVLMADKGVTRWTVNGNDYEMFAPNKMLERSTEGVILVDSPPNGYTVCWPDPNGDYLSTSMGSEGSARKFYSSMVGGRLNWGKRIDAGSN